MNYITDTSFPWIIYQNKEDDEQNTMMNILQVYLLWMDSEEMDGLDVLMEMRIDRYMWYC